MKRIVTGLPVGRFFSCLMQSFTQAGRKEARTKLPGPKAAGPLAFGRTGVLWKKILENFMVILYLSNPSVFALVGVTCGVISRNVSCPLVF